MGKIKEFAKKIVSDVPKSKEFILHYGGHQRVVKNLIDLRIELESMSQDEFSHHVNTQRNDFSSWIEHAVKDEKLAHDVTSATSPSALVELVRKRIDFAVSIIEEENKKIIDKELKKLKELKKKTRTTPKIEHQIESLEEGLKTVKKNESVEEKLLADYDDDLSIKPWHEYQGIPAHARIIEFIFGLVIGLIAGLFIARVMFF